jgi:predicted amidophosphoribosyltransferase
LEGGDECHYLGEYTARKGFAHSETNNLILNLKKSIAVRGSAQWEYKQRAIMRAGITLRNALNPEWLDTATLVPIPPSKARDHALYDDRMLQVLRVIGTNRDIRELIVQGASTDAAHESEHRPSPDEIAAIYQIDEALAQPAPTLIGVFDDVLTKGSHFKAAQRVLRDRFPGVPVCGIFIARRAPEADDLDIAAILNLF